LRGLILPPAPASPAPSPGEARHRLARRRERPGDGRPRHDPPRMSLALLAMAAAIVVGMLT